MSARGKIPVELWRIGYSRHLNTVPKITPDNYERKRCATWVLLFKDPSWDNGIISDYAFSPWGAPPPVPNKNMIWVHPTYEQMMQVDALLIKEFKVGVKKPKTPEPYRAS